MLTTSALLDYLCRSDMYPCFRSEVQTKSFAFYSGWIFSYHWWLSFEPFWIHHKIDQIIISSAVRKGYKSLPPTSSLAILHTCRDSFFMCTDVT